MTPPRLVFRVHAIRRMFEREITDEEVKQVIEAGEAVEDYPDEKPYPCKLVLGFSGVRPIHVVIADSADAAEIIVVTAYEPEAYRWQPDFKRRKK